MNQLVQTRMLDRRRRRIRMTKRVLRHLPRRATLHRYPFMRRFAVAARRRAFLWRFNPRSMAPAFYFGSVLALLPLYGFQIPLAFAAAFFIRANLPAMVGLQFITNPVTLAPIYYLTYQVGSRVLDLVGSTYAISVFEHRAYSLILGGLLSGLALGCVLDLAYRGFVFEAKKRDWSVPLRRKDKESASP